MASWEYELVEPPSDPDDRARWLEHAAGFILCEDVRRYAEARIDSKLSNEVRTEIRKGIDDALYGLMMVIGGVTGGLSNPTHRVQIEFKAQLVKLNENSPDMLLGERDLSASGQVCGDYHGWIEGDFGEHPVASPKTCSD